MRAWERAPYDTTCGGCTGRIRTGEPRFVMQPTGEIGTRRKFYRCAACAGEKAPENPPEFVSESFPRFMPPTPLTRRPMAAMAQDWKAKSLGREPGSDDE